MTKIPDVGPEPQSHSRGRGEGLDQRLLEIRTVNLQVRRAPAVLGPPAQPVAKAQRARPRRADLRRLRLKTHLTKRRLEPEIEQDPRGVGAELHAGADLAQNGRSFQNSHGHATAAQSQSRRQSADAGADENCVHALDSAGWLKRVYAVVDVSYPRVKTYAPIGGIGLVRVVDRRRETTPPRP